MTTPAETKPGEVTKLAELIAMIATRVFLAMVPNGNGDGYAGQEAITKAAETARLIVRAADWEADDMVENDEI